jgi:hypothetical protein
MASELATYVNKMVNELFGSKFEVNHTDMYYEISHRDKRCLYFKFSDDFSSLHIYTLATCGDARNGKSLMGLMNDLAASIPNFKYMSLQDASGLIICGNKIGLAHLKILTSDTAESWYGSLGYKAPTDVSDKNHNQRIVNMTVDEAFSDGIESKIIDPSKSAGLKQREMKLFGRLDTDKMSVKDYVKTIVESIREFKDKRQCSPDEMEKNHICVFYNTRAWKTVKIWHEPRSYFKKTKCEHFIWNDRERFIWNHSRKTVCQYDSRWYWNWVWRTEGHET